MNNNDYQQMYDLCDQHMHSYVLAEMNDGTRFNGVVTGVDENNVYLAVPGGGEEPAEQRADEPDEDESRQFGWRPRRPYYGGFYGYPHYPHYPHYGYGYPGYGYGYPGYGYYGYGPGRFGRLVLPLAGLTALSLLPWY